MNKSAMKCNETLGKWCKNTHGASKIIDTLETYQRPPWPSARGDSRERQSGGSEPPASGGVAASPATITMREVERWVAGGGASDWAGEARAVGRRQRQRVAGRDNGWGATVYGSGGELV
jgi:hypothetical protein